VRLTASDFNVTEVVDKTKGVHALIRKSEFSAAPMTATASNK
jgi:hypothetical protein